MNSRRILVISAVPSHPHIQGNRKRIFNMLMGLKKLGCHITFVYFLQPLIDSIPDKKDFNEMKECWDEFYAVPLAKGTVKFKDKITHGTEGFLRNFPLLHNWLKKAFYRKPDFIPLSRLYNSALDGFVKDLLKKKTFDSVLVQYIFLSKVLDNFDSKITKVIDAHDVFTDKHKSIINEFKTYGWISATQEEEARALERADIVIAIQDKEKEFFSKIINKKVVTVGHLAEPHQIKPFLGKKRILFVGSENDPNVHGMKYFMKEIFPKIRAKFPDSRLILAGRICNFFKDGKGITTLGPLSDVEIAYDLADVVISPIFLGTGLKIKNIEALSYCKPLITTSNCAGELGKDAIKCLLVADKPEEWVNAITKIFSNKKFAEKMSKNAHNFMKKYNAGNLRTLKEIFNIK